MSINFNKLFIQDIIARRGSSHAMNDLNETNIGRKDDELQSSSDELEYAGTDVSDDTDDTIEPSKRMESTSLEQKYRLVEAFRELRLAVNRQTELHARLNGYIGGQMLGTLEAAAEEHEKEDHIHIDSSPSHDSTPQVRSSCLASLKENCDDAMHHTKIHHNRKRVTTKSHSTERLPNVANDHELYSIKRCDRLSKKRERVVVEVRVVFLKIGEIDTLKEIYHADVFIQAKWRETRFDGKTDEELRKIDLQRCWNPLILIDNILTESKEHHWMLTQKSETNEVYIIERRRLRGVFLETLELNDFPLDVQDLTVTLTSERPDSEVVLVPDKQELCGINVQTFVDQQEWRLHEHIEVTMRSASQEYTNSSRYHHCISVTCRAARRPGYFYWNVFLIMFFITGLSFATFAVPPERPENRLQLSFTLFLTSVAFKFVINQSLPKISYLTYMDKYVLMSLAILCVSSVWHAVVTLIPPEQLLTGLKEDVLFGNDLVNQTLKGQKLTQENIQTKNHTYVPLIPQLDTQNANKSSLGSENLFFSSDTLFGLSPLPPGAVPFFSELASQTRDTARQKRILRQRIEKDVFVSFGLLYILAHLTFLFWFYFDASKRRREMVERDRRYKRCLQASKATEPKEA